MYGGTELYSKSFLYTYGSMFYHSVLSFALVEIAPRSSMQILICVIVYLISAMVNANIFGVFAVL